MLTSIPLSIANVMLIVTKMMTSIVADIELFLYF